MLQDQAETSDQERERIRHKCPFLPLVAWHILISLSQNNPIVSLGFGSVTIRSSIAPIEVTYWRGTREVLELSGTEVLVTRVPATGSPIDRAKVLANRISSVYQNHEVTSFYWYVQTRRIVCRTHGSNLRLIIPRDVVW